MVLWNNDPIEENEGNPNALADYVADLKRDWNSIDWNPIRLLIYLFVAALTAGILAGYLTRVSPR